MLSETTLKRLCKPAVYKRALRAVESGEQVFRRSCSFEEGEIVLNARVDAQSSWDVAHRTMVVLDEDAESVTYYECDCRALHASDSPCDHVMALLIDFCQSPELYEGYENRGGVRTTRNAARLMERADAAQGELLQTNLMPVGAGSVRLEPVLGYEVGFDVRFRIVGVKGSYSLKSIGEFAERVESGSFFSYGKSLAFEHARYAFAPDAWLAAEFLVRAVQNRRAYARERVTSRSMAATSPVQVGRELRLSGPELWELLDIYKDAGVQFEDRSTSGTADAGVRTMRIARDNPAVVVRILELEDGGCELVRPANQRVVSVGGRALAWDANTLYCCTASFSKDVEMLSALLANPGERMVISERDVPRFCSTTLRRLEGCVAVDVPDRLEDLRPLPCELEFYLDYHRRQDLVVCDPRAKYGDVVVPLLDTSSWSEDEPGSEGPVRDLRKESHAREVMRHFFVFREGRAYAQARGEELGVVVYEAVSALQEIGSVYAYPAFERLRRTTRPVIRVGLSVRSNLLNLNLRLEGLPQEELAGLLSSYSQRKRYHRLSDGSFVNMQDANVGEAGRVMEELDLRPGSIEGSMELPAYRALLLDRMVAQDDRDVSFEEYVSRVRSAGRMDRKVPSSLSTVLRSYQREGFRWLSGLCELGLCGILADEMGLGKSIQLISFLLSFREDAREVGPSLVVCPSSLVYNWQAEFARFAPELVVRVVSGLPQERAEVRRMPGSDVLITSYDLLRRDVGEYEDMDFWCVALDEAQYIKNPTTQAAESVRRIRSQNRVALTGTPVENRLSELWSIFDFLMPGLLGSYERFRERFERPIVEDEDKQVAAHLRDSLKPFILRRTKRDVARDLPEKVEQIVRTSMGSEQRKLYDAQAYAARTEVQEHGDEGGGRFQILALLTRLRQICCDPRLLYEDYEGMSCKTDAILTLIRRVTDAGEKMLVFSQFTSYLDVLAGRLEEEGIAYYEIRGSTPSSRRVELVNRFNSNSTPVFLISLKAGGTGLNLTGATVVVHADPWWNEAAQNQATDRVHRIGQTREVTVYKVIVSDTIEERILELQQTKSELADAVVQGDVSSLSLASLTYEDLQDLLG